MTLEAGSKESGPRPRRALLADLALAVLKAMCSPLPRRTPPASAVSARTVPSGLSRVPDTQEPGIRRVKAGQRVEHVEVRQFLPLDVPGGYQRVRRSWRLSGGNKMS